MTAQAVSPMRAARRTSADKFGDRRRELAESALRTLGELGYARTSLREIASNSEFSHGVVHYYFHDKLVETLVDEAPMHRLWYDLRSQSMFEASLRDAVASIDSALEEMIWRILTRYSELSGIAPSVTAPVAYGLLDGLFQQALLGHLAGRPAALDELRTEAGQALRLVFPAAS